MLLYIVNRRILMKTFVVMCKPTDTMARVRAHLLHMLYELDKLSHFQLRYNGEYLRDGFSVEDYRLPDNAVLKMIPVTRQASSTNSDTSLRKRSETLEIREESTVSSLDDSVLSGAFQSEVDKTLNREIKIFDRRERLFTDLNVCLYFHWFASLGGFLSSHWYSGVWATVLAIFALKYCPYFTRISGFVQGGRLGTTPGRRKFFLIIVLIFTILNFAASLVLSTLNFILLSTNCGSDGVCSATVRFSVFYFPAYAVLLIVTGTFAALLVYTIDVEVGDLLEAKLGQERDILKVLKVARIGRKKEKRVAAFELATLAAFSDDNKYLIAAEREGMAAIVDLLSFDDAETVEYGVETLANLVTLQTLQNSVADANGIEALLKLVSSRTTSSKTLTDALTTLSYLASDTHDHKKRVASTEGLTAFADAALDAGPQLTEDNYKTIAALLLEVAFVPEIRVSMLRHSRLRSALMKMAVISDASIDSADVVLASLQCIELLIIEEKENEEEVDGFVRRGEGDPSDSLPRQVMATIRSVLPSTTDSADDDDHVLSPSRRALLRVSCKLLRHLLKWRPRTVRVTGGEPLEFFALARCLARGFCTRDDADVSLTLAALMAERLVDETETAEEKKLIAAFVDEMLEKCVAAEDRDAWNAFDACKRRLGSVQE